MLRRLHLADMDAAARVHRAAFDHALPLAERAGRSYFTPNGDVDA